MLHGVWGRGIHRVREVVPPLKKDKMMLKVPCLEPVRRGDLEHLGSLLDHGVNPLAVRVLP